MATCGTFSGVHPTVGQGDTVYFRLAGVTPGQHEQNEMFLLLCPQNHLDPERTFHLKRFNPKMRVIVPCGVRWADDGNLIGVGEPASNPGPVTGVPLGV